MHIELTEQQRQLAQEGQPIDLIDPQTNVAYVLLARQQFERLRPSLAPQTSVVTVPEGIRLSQAAFRHDLPQLLAEKHLIGQWIAYHRHEQIGTASDQAVLIRECLKRGLDDDEFYVGWIDPCELLEEEEVAPRPQHFNE